MKKLSIIVALALLCVLLSGCVLGSSQTMNAVSMKCTVLAADTGHPIEGARVEVLFAGANVGSKPLPPVVFFTSPSGVCQVEIPKKTIWISGSDAFVGGYLRCLLVSAAGYEDAGMNEGFEKGMLGRTAEKTFRLGRKRLGSTVEEPNPEGSVARSRHRTLDEQARHLLPEIFHAANSSSPHAETPIF